jgi:predicted deacylase
MARSQTRLVAEIDFERNGKQHGFIRLPYSVHRSAYGWIPIPVASIKNGNGPRILLMAGNHGDEYEGQVALGKLIRSLEPAEVSGRIIICPQRTSRRRWPECALRRSTRATSTAASRAIPMAAQPRRSPTTYRHVLQ